MVVEDAVNDLIFAAAEAGVSVTDLAVPLLTQLLGLPPTAEPVVRVLLNRTTLGLFGPLISGEGRSGLPAKTFSTHSLRRTATIINAIIGAQGTVADGFVNGRFGPDLDDLLTGLAPFPILAGGIINPGNLSTLPGSVPTAQTLVTLLFGLLAPADMAINSTAASERLVEDAVNDLIFAAAEAGVSVTDLAVPLLTQLLGLPPTAEPVVRVLLARTTLGLVRAADQRGGATGTAIQDVLDSLGSGDLATIINAIIGAQGTVANGLVNGRFGPNLGPLGGCPSPAHHPGRRNYQPREPPDHSSRFRPHGADVSNAALRIACAPGHGERHQRTGECRASSSRANSRRRPRRRAGRGPDGCARASWTILVNCPTTSHNSSKMWPSSRSHFHWRSSSWSNKRIDAVQVAGKTVGLTVFGTLPEDLRAPAAALPLAIEGVIDDVQVAVEDAATPTPQPLQATQAGGGPQLQRLSGTGLDQKDQAGDPGVPPKKPRGPFINILKNNPLNRGGGGAHS